jgi:hypothetical protein
MPQLFVIAGLDPSIHAASQNTRHFSMDHRVKPGGDDCQFPRRATRRAVRVRENHAALARSAIATNERKISVAPLRRSGGESHSSKNTTFMSGRTRAPTGCLAM